MNLCYACKEKPKKNGSYCSDCKRERNRLWRNDHRERERDRYKKFYKSRYGIDQEWTEKKKESYRKSARKMKYGVDQETFDWLREQQDNKCAICMCDMIKPHIDHDHATAEVRGLLCVRCNSGLGFFQDSTEALGRAISYLEKPSIGIYYHSIRPSS